MGLSYYRKWRSWCVPRPYIILHHELMDSFCWMGHVNFAFAIFKICLLVFSDTAETVGKAIDLLHDVCESCSMIQVKAEKDR